jgi:hypothetical protein
VIRDRLLDVRCEVITVYGPSDHDWSMSFLEELDAKCQRLLLPTIIGGDFNLNNKDISGQDFGGGDQRLVDAFNSFIEKLNLKEVYRNGPKFTWTNKQEIMIHSNIDREY